MLERHKYNFLNPTQKKRAANINSFTEERRAYTDRHRRPQGFSFQPHGEKSHGRALSEGKKGSTILHYPCGTAKSTINTLHLLGSHQTNRTLFAVLALKRYILSWTNTHALQKRKRKDYQQRCLKEKRHRTHFSLSPLKNLKMMLYFCP